MRNPTRPLLHYALARFPKDQRLMRRLFLSDEEFRELCIDYGLANESLSRLKGMADADRRPEIAEYRTVIAELGMDLEKYLRKLGKRGAGLMDLSGRISQ